MAPTTSWWPVPLKPPPTRKPGRRKSRPPSPPFFPADERGGLPYHGRVHPADIQQIGGELAIKWDDGRESFIPLEMCASPVPSAGAQGGGAFRGNLQKAKE